MTQGFESFLDTAQYICTMILSENQDIFTNSYNKKCYFNKIQVIDQNSLKTLQNWSITTCFHLN